MASTHILLADLNFQSHKSGMNPSKLQQFGGGTLDSRAVSLAAVVAAISGILWPLALALILLRGNGTGVRPLWDQPWLLLLNGLQSAAFLTSAWLLEKDRWQGAAVASLLYATAAARSMINGDGMGIHAITTLTAFVITILAFRALLPQRG